MSTPVVKPPRAEKRPRVETWHGHEKRDDYHWLKAENWQEVMHDPSLLPALESALESRNGSAPAAREDENVVYTERSRADTRAVHSHRMGLLSIFKRQGDTPRATPTSESGDEVQRARTRARSALPRRDPRLRGGNALGREQPR